ncbi:hypothetical protein QA644_34665 (plasmid) [Rhizobium sp. CC1099]|uniref:hypothetical protein n=1 Tax=Rhizobium sp. CC1099 TaxID=3039160 RepID=UPI0024B0D5AE|nr:hypothetical protein [Rhizobium sp. CC1099]WFU92039.1 hypothetical protein QA644_34665 [Rhizobium sp. CC1099]
MNANLNMAVADCGRAVFGQRGRSIHLASRIIFADLAVQRGSNWVNAPADDAHVELRPIYKPIILEIIGQRRRLLSVAEEDEAPGYETEEAGEIL